MQGIIHAKPDSPLQFFKISVCSQASGKKAKACLILKTNMLSLDIIKTLHIRRPTKLGRSLLLSLLMHRICNCKMRTLKRPAYHWSKKQRHELLTIQRDHEARTCSHQKSGHRGNGRAVERTLEGDGLRSSLPHLGPPQMLPACK